MSIRVAIHGQGGQFTDKWIEYCQTSGIEHEVVCGYENDIIERLRGFDAFLWHFLHREPADLLMARHVLYAAAEMGVATYPDFRSCWHFDDKIAQKYLLEAIGAPLAPTYVFYDKATALKWLQTAEYPLVRKLRRGAGSSNVGLLRGFDQARRYCRRAFGRGFAPIPGQFTTAASRMRGVRTGTSLLQKLGKLPSAFARLHRARRQIQREKGYVLFQKYMPGNEWDYRVKVIGDRAWGFRRFVRKGDFRASGSGRLDLDHSQVPLEMVSVAYETAATLGTQSLAFDFVHDPAGRPVILEVSYGFGYDEGESDGYWDPELVWHDEPFGPWGLMVDDLIERVRRREVAR